MQTKTAAPIRPRPADPQLRGPSEQFRHHGIKVVILGSHGGLDSAPGLRGSLQRTFAHFASTATAPDLVFFGGVLVFTQLVDRSGLDSQLRAWRNRYRPHGHGDPGSARPETAARAKALQPYARGTDLSGLWRVRIDSSGLTYSFGYRGARFLVVNTEPSPRDAKVQWRWIQEDLHASLAAGDTAVFAIGYRPERSSREPEVIQALAHVSPAVPAPSVSVLRWLPTIGVLAIAALLYLSLR